MTSVFSALTVLTINRLSRRFRALAGDSELWKRRYFARWVLPRARSVPQSKQLKISTGTVYSPRVSKWLGHSHLATDDNQSIHWKTQYRLRHNWSKGTCRLDELEVSRPPLSQILIKLYSSVVITADKEHGLRAWSTKSPKKQLTVLPFPKVDDTPTALFVTKDSISSAASSPIEITVGFSDGHFSIYNLDATSAEFTLRFSQTSTSNATITAIASAPPYLLTISQHQVFHLYKIPSHAPHNEKSSTPEPLRLLTTLESNNTFAPMSLSLRCSASEVIASIAYSFFHISNGWTIGIQELRFNEDGEHITSRLATTVAAQPKADENDPSNDAENNNRNTSNRVVNLVSSTHSIQHKEAPTSLSYSHPFLLTSHGDNTLTMYLVFSSADKLFIRNSRRLWGHTSSVSSVQVGDRGKAVSVSPRGNEIRIWELENAVSSASSPLSSRSRSIRGESSVQLNCEKPTAGTTISLDTTSGAKDWSRHVFPMDPNSVSSPSLPSIQESDGWVGFDEEQVIVLRQRGLRAQFLECYDFT